SLGMEGISKSEVSRICADLDEVVERFRNRPLEGSYPYLWLDATYIKVRDQERVVSMAMVVAVGIRSSGEREIIGLDVGPADDRSFWLTFLRSLGARGLQGVLLAISDAHQGLRAAIEVALGNARWQRCRVHFMRNALALVGKAHQDFVAAALRTIFLQPDKGSAKAQLRQVADNFRDRFPKLVELLEEAAEDVLAYMSFPSEHRRQIHSTNPLERLNYEVKRRADVVGIFPNRSAAIRLLGSVLQEQNDEWATGRRYFSQESMNKLGSLQTGPDAKALLAAD
ncbi:MAG: IS256 family transposase, partial [Mycobacterium leprae]